jgi:CHAT domain-containing protein
MRSRFSGFAVLSCALVLVCAAPLANAQSVAAPASETALLPFTAPPRRVDDILRLLDHYRPEPALVQRARDSVAMVPPAGTDGELLVDFFRRRAAAAARLGQVDRQIADLQAAIGHSQPNSLARAALLGTLATAQSTGDSQLAAARSSDEALLQLPRGNPGRQLGLLQASVKYYASLGDLPAARERLQRAEQIFAQLSGGRGWAQRGSQWTAMIQRARAEVFLAEGRLIEAEGALRKAMAAFDAHLRQNPPDADGDSVQRYDGVLERTLAVTLLQQGRLAEAEFHVRHALRMTLERVGRDSVDVGQGLAVLSNILGEQGRNAEATRVAEASMRAYLEAGAAEFSLNLARARQFLGAALSAQGRHAEAVEVFERNRDILKRDPELLQKYGVGHPEWVISLLQTGKPQAAERMAAAMLTWSVSRFGDDNPRAALRRALVGVARVDQGDAVGARQLFEASVPILLAQVRDDAESETGSLRKQRYLIFVLEAWLRALAATGDTTAAAEAFRIADIARGSMVQRALTAAAARAAASDSGTGADAELPAMARQEQDTQRRLNGLSTLLTQLLAAPPGEQLPQVQEALRRDIAAAMGERDTLRRALAERFPDYASLVRPQPATLAATRAVLRPGEALLAFYVGERESYVWAAAPTGASHFSRVSLGREEVAGTVKQLRRALDAGVGSIDALPPFDLATAHALYTRFVAPAAEVWREATTLVVVPHGDLAQLPLSLLPTAAATHGSGDPPFAGYRLVPWLLRTHAIQQLPSATALVSLRRLAPRAAVSGSFVGFGDPLFSAHQAAAPLDYAPASATAAVHRGGRSRLMLRGQASSAAVESATLAQLPPLPDTGIELRAIAASLQADPRKDVFLRREATEQRVREMDRARELARRRVVMFATHGLVPGDIDGLTQPALALSSPEAVPEAGDGLLTMDEVLGLRLDADWVVLSACNTAAGEGAGAEALSGLGRAFFYAGARALLVSDWPVETTSARQLMTGMFAQLAADSSLSKPQALRRSMLTLIDSPGATGPGGRIEFSYAHPLFWAPFVVVGD